MQIQNTNTKNKLNIGNVELESIVSLAPMAGITDTVLRGLVRKFSPNSLLFTEMISSEALKFNRDQSILAHEKTEIPMAFQLSGHKPLLMAEGAKQLEPIATTIDINMGCPAPKIVRNGDGSALMRDPKLASEIISSVKNAVNIPVTVKYRLGWDIPTKNYLEFSKMAQESGADAVIVHGRTKTQMYSGIPDWEAIGEIKESLSIPVIGNGDITSVKKAIECLNISKCDGLAIGRGILGDPELIYRIEHYLKTGEIIPEPTQSRRIELLREHWVKEMHFRGESTGMRYMRKFFAWYIKDIKGASKYRHRLVTSDKIEEVEAILKEIEHAGE